MPTYRCSKCKAKAEYQMPVRDARLWDFRCEKHKTPVHSKIAAAPKRSAGTRARAKKRVRR